MTVLLSACSLPGFEAATAVVPTLIPPGGTVIVPGGTLVVPNGAGGEETATPIDTAVATAGIPITGVTAAPVIVVTATPIPVIPPTPTVPMVTPNAVNVNCRSGPDMAYDTISMLPFGASTQVLGRTTDSSWWYVQDPNNPTGHCWINASVVTILGPTAGIPIAVLPAAIANQITIAVTTPPVIVCGAQNAIGLSGTISTNGAATVTYQWEITGNVTTTTTPQTLAFTGAGTQNVAGPSGIAVDCGNYAVSLHVTSPNDLSASKTFTVSNP